MKKNCYFAQIMILTWYNILNMFENIRPILYYSYIYTNKCVCTAKKITDLCGNLIR